MNFTFLVKFLYSSCKLYILGTMLPFLWHETYIEGKWTQTLYLLFSSWDISLSLIWPKRDVSLTCRGRKENISRSLASFCEIAPKASDESRTYIDAHDDWFVQVPTSQGQSCVQMTQALELIFNFLVKSKISTVVTVTFLWTLFSELSAHASDFFS